METTDLKLVYHQPAGTWTEALPVGNGRLGGMIFGGIWEERIQLNEDTLWAGPPVPQDRTGAREHIDEARKLLFEGKYAEAQEQVQEHVMGERISPRSYQTLGDIRLSFASDGPVQNYGRNLDLDTAISAVSYTQNGVTFNREVFVSSVHQVLIVQINADTPGSISLKAGLDRPCDFAVETIDANTLAMTGQATHEGNHPGVRFAAYLQVVPQGGETSIAENILVIQNADAVTCLLAAETDFNPEDPYTSLETAWIETCKTLLSKAAAEPYGTLKDIHIAEHERLFRRVCLDLGPAPDMPTDQRLQAVQAGAVDTALTALYFQYARYLMICSSRPGCMAANLQGIWNGEIEAPWNSDYHININIQMIYWLAEVGNLAECHEPFFDLAERLRKAGRNTARTVYGCRGIVAHHTTDAWYHTPPFGKVQYGMWPMGAAWCTQHLMEHHRFNGDDVFLADRAYPLLKEAAAFFLDWLVEDPETGKLVSGPSSSPENRFIAPDGTDQNLTMGPAMDQQIIWDTFTNCLEAAGRLGISDAFTAEVETALKRLADPGIGSDGRLLEWNREFEEFWPGHRHISHLFAVHPGRQYTLRKTPERIAAARKSIEHRLAHGGGHTGWSRGWIINFWARFQDGENAFENVQLLLGKSTLPNLFDTHPPFQIDGNFGGAAGIAEMLLQSHDDCVDLLPALPRAWPDGSVKGLRTRGGYTVDLSWQAGILKEAILTADRAGTLHLRYKERSMKVDLEENDRFRVIMGAYRLDGRRL